MEQWKMLKLLPPPVLTIPTKQEIDEEELDHICKNIVRVLSKQSPFHNESALLSRFLYKYDKKFRNDIGYRNLKKTSTALKKYLQLNLLKDVEKFMSYLPQDGDKNFPSKQILEYLLTKIITFSKLMVRVCVCSKQAAVFYLDRIKRGESHWMSVMPYALLSRLWSMSNVLLQHSVSWYKCLHPYLSILQLMGLDFLPKGYQLPKDLGEWLDLKSLDEFGRLEWSQKKQPSIALSLEDEESDTFNSVLNYINEINKDDTLDIEDNAEDMEVEEAPIVPQTNTNPKQEEVDLGEIVSRESLKILDNFQKKITTTPQSSHYFGKVVDITSLNQFINTEESFRNNNDEQSLTKHLSFMQWMTLKNALFKECNLLARKNKIEKKLQKVWEEKCLHYK